jgi:hypothetical protein
VPTKEIKEIQRIKKAERGSIIHFTFPNSEEKSKLYDTAWPLNKTFTERQIKTKAPMPVKNAVTCAFNLFGKKTDKSPPNNTKQIP